MKKLAGALALTLALAQVVTTVPVWAAETTEQIIETTEQLIEQSVSGNDVVKPEKATPTIIKDEFYLRHPVAGRVSSENVDVASVGSDNQVQFDLSVVYGYRYEKAPTETSVNLGKPEISVTSNMNGGSVDYQMEQSKLTVTLPDGFKAGDSYEVVFSAVNIVLEIDGTSYNINPDQTTTFRINMVESNVKLNAPTSLFWGEFHDVEWTGVEDAESYQVTLWYKKSNEETWTKSKSLSTASTSCTFYSTVNEMLNTDEYESVSFYYEVYAVKGDVQSEVVKSSTITHQTEIVETPSNLRWDGYAAMWDYSDQWGNFKVVFNYKDKNNNWNTEEYDLVDVGAYTTNNSYRKDFTKLINALTIDENVLATEFYFKVCVTNSRSEQKSDYVTSETITINVLPAPSNVGWDGYVAKWDAVEGAEGYQLNLYFKDSEGDRWIRWGLVNTFSNNSYYDYSQFIESEVENGKNYYDYIEFYYTVGVADKNNNLVSSVVDSEILKIEFEKDPGTEVEGLKAVTNLRWSDKTPGMAEFYNPNEGNVKFTLQCFKDDEQYAMASWSTSAYGAGDVTLPVNFDITESGNYKYKVEVFAYGQEEDWELTNGCVSEWSEVFAYTRPDKQVAVPTNIKWDSTGMVTWDKVENANHYWSYLYVKDSTATWNDGYRPMGGSGSMDNFHDYADKLADGYEYYVRIKANSENINEYANGDYSEYIPFKQNEVADKVNGKLEEKIPENITSENVQQVVTDVKDSFADAAAKAELQVAMQTDAATRDKIETLEEEYMKSKGVSTSVTPAEDVGIDASTVSVLGAGLNATEAGSVEFKMSKPDEEVQKDLITNTQFTKAIVLDLELEGAGIKSGEELAIPVTITMNAPAGIDVSKLTILHYNKDNTSYEKLPVRKNSDGTISFTVTHFSNFMFAEEEPSTPEPDNKVVVGNGGATYEVYDAEEVRNNAFAKEVENRVKAEEAIQVASFVSKEALNALPAEVKGMTSKDTVYNISKITTTQGFVAALDKIVKATPKNGKVTLYSSEPFAFNKKALAAVTNANKDIVYIFNHKGHLYQVTIPAGVKVDLSLATFAGPLYIGAQLGTSVLIK